MQNTAVIVAAGCGSRMKKIVENGKTVNKVYRSDIGGVPILSYTLRAFEACDAIDGIVIVTRREDIKDAEKLCEYSGFKKIRCITEGGKTRQESVYNGLLKVPDGDMAVIHDGARCLIDGDTIKRVIGAAEKYGAAACAVKAKDSLKRVDEDGYISENIERDGVWCMQTPQVFLKEDIISAYNYIRKKNISVTDDCGAAELCKIKVRIVDGSFNNIKITTEEDMVFARAVLEK